MTCIKYTMMKMNNNLNIVNPNINSIHLIMSLKHSLSMRTFFMIQNHYSQNYITFSYHVSVSTINNIMINPVKNTILKRLQNIFSVNQKKKYNIKQISNTIIVCGNQIQIIANKLINIRMHT